LVFHLLKTFKERLEIKINLRDILAQDLIFYQDINKNGKLDKNSIKSNDEKLHNYDTDNVMIRSRFAPTISFSIGYRF
jgi:hypothetical protein